MRENGCFTIEMERKNNVVVTTKEILMEIGNGHMTTAKPGVKKCFTMGLKKG